MAGAPRAQPISLRLRPPDSVNGYPPQFHHPLLLLKPLRRASRVWLRKQQDSSYRLTRASASAKGVIGLFSFVRL